MQAVGLRSGVLLAVLVLAACAWTTAARPVCRMNIQGTGSRAVSNASLVCTGGTITAVADKSLLGPFTSGFRGVEWDQGRCGGSNCLLTICGNTTAKFVQSSMKNLNATDTLTGIACVIDNSVVSFEQSIFASNMAENGTLHVRDTTRVALLNTNVIGNLAFGGNPDSMYYREEPWNGKGAGAGLHVRGFAEVTLSGTNISSNIASSFGVGIWTEGNARVVMSNSNVHNNSAGMHGGGLYATDLATVLILNYSTFSNNRAKKDGGGGVYANGNASITVANSSTFSNNNAGSGGGGAYAGGNARIIVANNSTFSSNSAERGGGAYASSRASIMVTNSSTFSHNNAFDGGGAYADQMASITVTNSSTFINNSAANGGGLKCREYSICQVVDSYICHHMVAGFGAGLSIGDAVEILIRNSTLMFNR
eukprot:jgi/Chrzof1/3638/Cz13g03110.t1